MVSSQPRAERNRLMHRVYAIPPVILGITAFIALTMPDEWRYPLHLGVVGIVVSAPLIRTVWLAIRWRRRGDTTYSVIAVVLLGVIALATVLTHLVRR